MKDRKTRAAGLSLWVVAAMFTCSTALTLLVRPCSGAALIPGNIIVSTRGTVFEYTTDGVQVQSFPIPYPQSPKPPTETARDVAVTPAGKIAVYNGTFHPYLSILDPVTETWTHLSHPGWDTANNVSYGGIAAHEGFIFVTDMFTYTPGNSPNGVVRFSPADAAAVRFDAGTDTIDLSVGLDGLLYVLSPGGSPEGHIVHVFDPLALTHLRTIDLKTIFGFTGHRSVAANSAGDILLADWSGDVHKVNAEGTLLSTARPCTSCNLFAIDVSETGLVAVGGGFGVIHILYDDRNTGTLAVLREFSVGGGEAFAAFVPGTVGVIAGGIPTAAYFPLQDGTSWTYTSPGGGTTVVTVLPGTVPVNSVPTKVTQSSGGSQTFYTSDASGIREHRMFDPAVPLDGTTVPVTWTFSPPVVLAPSRVTLGQVAHSSGSVLFQVGPLSYPLSYAASATFEGLETISVPLATFVALKVAVTVSMWGIIEGVPVSETVPQTAWLASHVGIVRLHDAEGTRALIATNIPPMPAALAAAVLPSSRSVQAGSVATAFATIATAGTGMARGCRIAPFTAVPGAEFLYQTTDPTTNALTGTVNTPVDIPAGANQSFLVAFVPTRPVGPTDVVLVFECDNTGPAPSMRGVNTLLLSASDAAVPDIVALAATLGANGIVDLTGATGAGAFAVAAVNVGASAPITASADTGGAPLPVALALCQTHPATGLCLSPVGPSVTTQINAGDTPTLAVFVSATGSPVPFDPGVNRIFARFRDAGGATRGSTSVAVRTP